MDISSVNNNQMDIQSILLNSTNQTNRANNTNGINNDDTTNKTAYYAKKGEPMYMAEMDSDEDGTVTLDEFREYCKSKNINSREMVKMNQIASSYRVMKAEENTIDYISKLIPNSANKTKQSETQPWYIRQEENKYNISNDSSRSNMVSYKDYMEYCQQNSISNDLKNNTTVEESDDGYLKISNTGKAVNFYKNNEESFVKSTFEEAV